MLENGNPNPNNIRSALTIGEGSKALQPHHFKANTKQRKQKKREGQRDNKVKEEEKVCLCERKEYIYIL